MTGNPDIRTGESGDYNAGNDSVDSVDLDRHFVPLEAVLATAGDLADRITSKHWHFAEREQYPFWIGVIIIALMGIVGMYIRDFSGMALSIAGIMFLGVIYVIISGLRNVQGRFDRQWQLYAGDGELFRFMREAATSLNYPLEVGNPDEHFIQSLSVPFPKAVRAVENYLGELSLPDPVPLDSPAGLYVPHHVLSNPPGGDSHRVYEIEYRGLANRTISIRIAATMDGSDVTIGYSPRPKLAQTRDHLTSSLLGRIQDRLIAAKILSDLRKSAGLPPLEIPNLETEDAGQPDFSRR